MSGMKSRKGHIGTSGEGMPQDRSDNRKAGGVARTRATLLRIAVAAALAGLLAGTNLSVARAADDSGADDTFLGKFMEKLGLSAPPDRTADINYSERPPLVVPPTRDLPPPQTTDAARRNAAWPIDQDEQRRRQAAAKRKQETRTFTWEDLSRQLSPNELRAGATSAKDQALRRNGDQVEDNERQYKPSELGYTGGVLGTMHDFFTGNNKDEKVPFEAEPPRASLTDPPSGYRSPSPAQPYGLTADTKKPKALTQEERVTAGSD
jgi:hypothetical protein